MLFIWMYIKILSRGSVPSTRIRVILIMMLKGKPFKVSHDRLIVQSSLEKIEKKVYSLDKKSILDNSR